MNLASSIRSTAAAFFTVISVFSTPASPALAQESSERLQPNFNEVSSSTLFFLSEQSTVQAPILNTSVHIEISGIVAKVKLEQTFENTSAEWVEGLYTFPLPDEAAAHSLVVKVGERTIVGRVREKQQAARLYEQAKSSGQVASLVEQQTPNLFSSKIANIAPEESVSISLEYIQTLKQTDARYDLRIPLTLTPRYQGAFIPTHQSHQPAQPTLFAHLDSPSQIKTHSHQVQITGRLFGVGSAKSLVSPSHSMSVAALDNATAFNIAPGSKLDRDFILQWTHGSDVTPGINAWRETVNGDDYLLASINPPANNESIPEQARELIIVVDTSGSMGGTSIEAAKSALLDALLGLGTNDKFNIIEFNSTHTALFDYPLAANTENLSAGRRFTQRLRADGGTEMLPALQQALSYGETESLRQIVFITDGAVGYEDNVMQFVTQRLQDARLFTVGIGHAPNPWFMRKVAEAGRGTASFITDTTQTRDVMARVLKVLATPAMTDLSVVFDDTGVEFTPNPVPDLYAGSAVVVAAKLTPNTNTLEISGHWGEKLWVQNIDLNVVPQVNTGLSTVWARRKIEALEDQQRHHADPNFFQSLITRVALEHQLLSRFTSFVALEETVVRPEEHPLKTAVVPNALPEGSQFQSVAFPQGGAGSDTFAWISAILALLSGLFWRRKPRTVQSANDDD